MSENTTFEPQSNGEVYHPSSDFLAKADMQVLGIKNQTVHNRIWKISGLNAPRNLNGTAMDKSAG